MSWRRRTSFGRGLTAGLLGILLLAPLACRPRVSLSLERQEVTVDSSGGYGYVIRVRQPVSATGMDGRRPYLAILSWRQTVSLKAGERPDSGIAIAFVSEGRGVGETSVYASKCSAGSPTAGDCIDHYIYPGYTFSLVGYIPIAPAR